MDGSREISDALLTELKICCHKPTLSHSMDFILIPWIFVFQARDKVGTCSINNIPDINVPERSELLSDGLRARDCADTRRVE